MKTSKLLVIGCCGVGVVVLVLAIVVVAFVWHVGQNPKDVSITVEGPSTVRPKEEFTLTIVVHNERTKADFGLTDVDIAEEYLQGFLVLSIDPKPKSSMHVPFDNKRSFTFDRRIEHGDTARFSFRLRPLKTGVLRGDIDVCEGLRFVTTQVQTLIEEPNERR